MLLMSTAMRRMRRVVAAAMRPRRTLASVPPTTSKQSARSLVTCVNWQYVRRAIGSSCAPTIRSAPYKRISLAWPRYCTPSSETIDSIDGCCKTVSDWTIYIYSLCRSIQWFLRHESSDCLLPTHSTCPKCSASIHWQELVRQWHQRRETDGSVSGSSQPSTATTTSTTTATATKRTRAKRKGVSQEPSVAAASKKRRVGGTSSTASVASSQPATVASSSWASLPDNLSDDDCSASHWRSREPHALQPISDDSNTESLAADMPATTATTSSSSSTATVVAPSSKEPARKAPKQRRLSRSSSNLL